MKTKQFRIFDKKQKSLVYFDFEDINQVQFLHKQGHSYIWVEVEGHFLKCPTKIKTENVDRFTGFYSKNKKPVYQGDIIEFKYVVGDQAWENMEEEERKERSKRDGKKFRGTIKKDLDGSTNLTIVTPMEVGTAYFPLSYIEGSKIIGNVYDCASSKK